MCYSKEASKKSIIVHVISLLILIIYGIKKNRNDMIVAAIVFFGVGSMQVGEYFIHDDPNCDKKMTDNMTVNKFGSLFGYFSLIIIQPIFSLLALQISDCSPKLKTNLSVVFFILFMINLFISIKNFPTEDELCTDKKECKEEYCTLDWKWNPWKKNSLSWPLYIILMLLIPLFAIKKTNLFFILVVIHLFLTMKFSKLWSGPASCYWGPIALYLFFILDLPKYFSEFQFIKEFRDYLS